MQLEEVPDKAAKVEKMESTMNKKRVQNAALWKRNIYLYDVEDVFANFQSVVVVPCNMLSDF